MKVILSFVGVILFLSLINYTSAQVVGYFEGPLGTTPLISPGVPSVNNNNNYNYGGSSPNIIEYESFIFKKKNEVTSISFLDMKSWFNISFNRIAFVGPNDVTIVEILGNTGATLSYIKQISFVGDYLVIDGKSKQIVRIAI